MLTIDNNNEIDYKILLKKYLRQMVVVKNNIVGNNTMALVKIFTEKELLELFRLEMEAIEDYGHYDDK